MRQEDGIGVGADAEKGRVTEADQAGVANQQHQADSGNGEDEDGTEFADIELAEHVWDRHQHEQ